MLFIKVFFIALALQLSGPLILAAPVITVSRATETVDLSRIRTYEEVEQQKLRRIWQAFKKVHMFTDEGRFEPAIPGAAECPDNPESQVAFIHHIKERSVEVVIHDFIRCGDCNGTGKRYVRGTDELTSSALEHLPCGGTGKLQAEITYRLIYSANPPARLPTRSQVRFGELQKRHAGGDMEAEYELGICHVQGRGTPKNIDKGAGYLAASAVRRDARAAFALGQQYENGFAGAGADYSTAIALYMLGRSLGGGSANLDNACRLAPANEVLCGQWLGRQVGRQFESGAVVSGDLTAQGMRRLAASSYSKAVARKTNQPGEASLYDGMVYLLGEADRRPDLQGAYAKFLLSAQSGNPDAIYCLGVFHEKGLAVPRSRPAAYALYSLAAGILDEEHVKVSQLRLAPTCRTEDLELKVANYLRRMSTKSANNEDLQQLLAFKDLDMPAEVAFGVAPKPDFPDIIDDKTGQKMKMLGTGSGLVFTPEGHVFTNKHVVDKGRAFTIHLRGVGAPRKARLVAVDSAHDLAILQFEDWRGVAETGHPLPSLMPKMPERGVKIGDAIFTIGFPVPGSLGYDPKFTAGHVSSPKTGGVLPGFVQITCPIQPGNSGGPLALADNGQVVGVVVGTIGLEFYIKQTNALPQGVNYAINIDHLHRLAERHSIAVPASAANIINWKEQIGAHSTLITSYE